MGKRVAVVLAGCGVFDGSEIHEASAVLVHLAVAIAVAGREQLYFIFVRFFRFFC